MVYIQIHHDITWLLSRPGQWGSVHLPSAWHWGFFLLYTARPHKCPNAVTQTLRSSFISACSDAHCCQPCRGSRSEMFPAHWGFSWPSRLTFCLRLHSDSDLGGMTSSYPTSCLASHESKHHQTRTQWTAEFPNLFAFNACHLHYATLISCVWTCAEPSVVGVSVPEKPANMIHKKRKKNE